MLLSIKEVEIPTIQENEVLIKTTYSSLNYKDALSSVGNPAVTKNFPHITGIDVAGVIEKSNSTEFEVGEKVLVTRYDLEMNTNGGHSKYVKIPDSWVVKMPQNISDKEIMTYGTAELTAALSVNVLVTDNWWSGKYDAVIDTVGGNILAEALI